MYTLNILGEMCRITTDNHGQDGSMVSFGMEAAEGPAFVVVELLVVTRQIVQILKSYQKTFGA